MTWSRSRKDCACSNYDMRGEKQMKKAAAVLLAGLMVFSMAACGNKEEKKETTKAAGKETTKAAGTETTKAAEGSEGESKDSGKLIMATEAGFAPYEMCIRDRFEKYSKVYPRAPPNSCPPGRRTSCGKV